MTTLSDDARLTDMLLRARHGDRRAGADFVRETEGPLRRMLVPLTRADPAATDDLAQETYTRAFASLAGYRADASALTWLLAIGRRVAADHRRRERRHAATTAVGDPVAVHEAGRGVAGGEPGARADPAEAAVLRRAIASLEVDRREAFVLTQLVGLSYEETAAVCGCPVGTVRSRVARARDDLVAMFHAGDAGDRAAGDPRPARGGDGRRRGRPRQRGVDDDV